MSSNIGHIINSTLRPPNSRATFPVSFSNENKGGLHSYLTITERNNIPQERRIVGMEVFVASGATKYLLSGGTSNSNWVAIPYFGAGSGPGSTSYLALSGGTGSTMYGDAYFGHKSIYDLNTIYADDGFGGPLAQSISFINRIGYTQLGEQIIDWHSNTLGFGFNTSNNYWTYFKNDTNTANRTITWRDLSGTVALLSDITGATISGAYLPTSGGTMFGNINMSGNNITNVITLDYTDGFGYSFIRNDSSGGIIYSQNVNGNSSFVADPTGPYMNNYDASNNSAGLTINASTGQLTFSSIDNSSTDRGSLTFKGSDGIGIKNTSGTTSYITNAGLTGSTIYKLPYKGTSNETFAMLSDVTANTVNLSGYLTTSAFTAYSAATFNSITANTALTNTKLNITDFNSYSANTAIGTGLTNYVNLTTNQTIGGNKTFTGTTTLQQTQINGQLLIGNPVDLQIRDAAGTIGTRAITGFNYLRGGNQNATTPTYGFTNSANAGMYAVTSDTIGFATASVKRFEIGTTGITASLPINATTYNVLDFSDGNYKQALSSNVVSSGLTVGSGFTFVYVPSLVVKDGVGVYRSALDSNGSNILRVGNGFNTISIPSSLVDHSLNFAAGTGSNSYGFRTSATLTGTSGATGTSSSFSIVNTINQTSGALGDIYGFNASPIVSSVSSAQKYVGFFSNISTPGGGGGQSYSNYHGGSASSFFNHKIQIGSNNGIADSNGIYLIKFPVLVSSAANYLVVNNNIAGDGFVTLGVDGTSANVGFNFVTKANGAFTFTNSGTGGFQLKSGIVNGTGSAFVLQAVATTAGESVLDLQNFATTTTSNKVAFKYAMKDTVGLVIPYSYTWSQTITGATTANTAAWGVDNYISGIRTNALTITGIDSVFTGKVTISGSTGTTYLLQSPSYNVLDFDGVTWRTALSSTSVNSLTLGSGFSSITIPTQTIGFSNSLVKFTTSLGATNFSFITIGGSFNNNGLEITRNSVITSTSGNNNLLTFGASGVQYAPVTGTGTFRVINITQPINSSGSATGEIDLIDINPTISGLASGSTLYGLRSRINSLVGSGTTYNLYIDGTAPNYFAGNTVVGNSSTSTFDAPIHRVLDFDGVTYRSALDSSANSILRIGNGFSILTTPATQFNFIGVNPVLNNVASVPFTIQNGAAGQPVNLQTLGGATANNGVIITTTTTATNNSNNRNVLLVSSNYTVSTAGAGTFQGARVRPTLTLSAAANQVISMVELFPAINSLTSGSTVYGLRSRLDIDPSGATVYNIYADGLAPNYFAGTITAKGFTDGTFAIAGNVGETIESLVSGYTNYTTTATYQPITSITLAAGDWEISTFATFNSNTATLTGAANAIFTLTTISSSASGATEGKTISYIPQAALVGASKQSSSSMRIRVSINTTTTYYLNTQATFTLGTPQYVGSILATRVR